MDCLPGPERTIELEIDSTPKTIEISIQASSDTVELVIESPNSAGIADIVSLTLQEYQSIEPNPNTLYLITC